MLESPLKREVIKAGGTILSVSAGGTVPVVLAATLGVAVEALGLLGQKRTQELFDSEQFTEAVVAKIRQSDDFASFVYSIWQKHNLESSAKRRRMLKSILQREATHEDNSFENFSRLEFLVQNISFDSLRLLKFFNTEVYKAVFKTEDGRYKNPNLDEIANVAEKSGFQIPYGDLEYRMNDLVNNGLAAVTHGLFNGPQYNQAKTGFLLLEYISEEI